MHIWSTDDPPGELHRPRESVPPNLDLDNVEITGRTPVEMGYPDTQELDDAEYFDTYTGKSYKGKRGIMVHLGQMAGQNNIPEDVSERFEADDFPIVETDEDGNITSVVKWGSDGVPPIEPYLPWYDNQDIGYVRRNKVRRLIEEAKSTDRQISPEEAEEVLLS